MSVKSDTVFEVVIRQDEQFFIIEDNVVSVRFYETPPAYKFPIGCQVLVSTPAHLVEYKIETPFTNLEEVCDHDIRKWLGFTK